MTAMRHKTQNEKQVPCPLLSPGGTVYEDDTVACRSAAGVVEPRCCLCFCALPPAVAGFLLGTLMPGVVTPRPERAAVFLLGALVSGVAGPWPERAFLDTVNCDGC